MEPWTRRRLLATLPAITACGGGVAPSRRPLHVACDLWAGYFPGLLAKDLGYFDDERVSVHIEVLPTTDDTLASLVARVYDGACLSLGDFIGLTDVDPEIRFAMASDESAGGDAVVSARPRPFGADWRGVRIGTNLGGFGEIFIDAWLSAHGVARDAVTLVQAEASEVPHLLAEGRLDAGHTWEPYVSQCVATGHQVWFSTAETPRLVLDGLAVHETSLRTRRDEWRGFARAWFRALTWWQDNPGAAEARLGGLLKLPPSQLQVAGTRLLDWPANERLFRGGDDAEIVAVARRYAEYFHHQGTLSQGLAAETLISRAVVGG